MVKNQRIQGTRFSDKPMVRRIKISNVRGDVGTREWSQIAKSNPIQSINMLGRKSAVTQAPQGQKVLEELHGEHLAAICLKNQG